MTMEEYCKEQARIANEVGVLTYTGQVHDWCQTAVVDFHKGLPTSPFPVPRHKAVAQRAADGSWEVVNSDELVCPPVFKLAQTGKDSFVIQTPLAETGAVKK